MASKPPKPEFDVETFDVACKSGRTFTLHVPNGKTQVNADRAAETPLAMMSYRVAAAILAIDHVKVAPFANDLDLSSRLQDMKASELDRCLSELGKRYSEAIQRKFELRELNGLEQARADRAAGDTIAIAAFRAVASVSSIDGQSVKPFTKDADIEVRLGEMSGPELNTITREYGENFANLSEEELGNGFAPEASPPTS